MQTRKPTIHKRTVLDGVMRCTSSALQAARFNSVTNARARRFRDHCVDVVEFNTYTEHEARRIGCTAHSVGVKLGVYVRIVPPPDAPRWRTHRAAAPALRECHFRRTLLKTITQRRLPRSDIWYVGARGQHISEVIGDIERVVAIEALPWFGRFGNLDDILETLRYDDPTPDSGCGSGHARSPLRDYLIAHIALELRRDDLALVHLERVLRSGAFPQSHHDIRVRIQHIRDHVVAV